MWKNTHSNLVRWDTIKNEDQSDLVAGQRVNDFWKSANQEISSKIFWNQERTAQISRVDRYDWMSQWQKKNTSLYDLAKVICCFCTFIYFINEVKLYFDLIWGTISELLHFIWCHVHDSSLSLIQIKPFKLSSDQLVLNLSSSSLVQVILYLTNSILVCLRIVQRIFQFWYVPELFTTYYSLWYLTVTLPHQHAMEVSKCETSQKS